MPLRSSEFGKFEPDDPDHPLIIIAERYRKTIYRKLVRHGYRDEYQLVVEYLDMLKTQLQHREVESAHKTLQNFILWLKRQEQYLGNKDETFSFTPAKKEPITLWHLD